MRNYKLEQHVHDVTRGADLNSPHRCSVVVDVLCQGDDCRVNFRTGNEALRCLVLDILDYLHKDPYLFELRYKSRMDTDNLINDANIALDMQYDMIDLIKQLMYDNGCEKVEETLYNYAD